MRSWSGLSAVRFFYSIALLISSLVLSLAIRDASAKEMHYKDYPLEIHDGDRLVISGMRVNIHLSSSSVSSGASASHGASGAVGKNPILHARKSVGDHAPKEDQSKFEAMLFGVRREGQDVIIEVKGPENKAAWTAWTKSSSTAPEFAFDIEGLSSPVEVLAHDGQVAINHFNRSAAVNLIAGHVSTSESEGPLRIAIQSGQVEVNKHHGRLDIDSYSARVAVQDLEGDLQLTNFSGESTITRATGGLDIKSHQGASILAKSSGSLDFLSGRGAISVSGFDGPVHGQTDLGPVSIGIEGDADVRVDSVQGTVNVKLPQDSGAALHMQSEEGSLSPPEGFKASGGGRSHLISGRLSGEGPKGTVTVKSKTGALRVRIS